MIEQSSGGGGGTALAGGIISLVLLAILIGPCLHTGPPSSQVNVNQQFHLLNRSLDALEQEIAASRVPGRGQFVLFILAVITPLAAAMWLIWRAERSQIGHDQVIRTMIRLGLREPVLGAWIQEWERRPRLTGYTARRTSLARRMAPRSPRDDQASTDQADDQVEPDADPPVGPRRVTAIRRDGLSTLQLHHLP